MCWNYCIFHLYYITPQRKKMSHHFIILFMWRKEKKRAYYRNWLLREIAFWWLAWVSARLRCRRQLLLGGWWRFPTRGRLWCTCLGYFTRFSWMLWFQMLVHCRRAWTIWQSFSAQNTPNFLWIECFMGLLWVFIESEIIPNSTGSPSFFQ